MTVYSELLLMALDADEENADRSIDELVALLVTRRQAMVEEEEGPALRSETPLVNSLAYDTVLVHLCRRLGVEEGLTLGTASPSERGLAEKRLAEEIPELAALFH